MTDFDFAGTHVIADVYDIDPRALLDEHLIMRGLERGIARSGATICGMQTKSFEPNGMTALYLLSESHVSVHTYPDRRALFFDAFTCGDHCAPEAILDELVAALGRCRHRSEIVGRGDRIPVPALGAARRLAPVLATGS